MKKILGAFAAGQSLQILILYVAIRLTYSTNTLAFCAIMGCVAMLMLCVGSGLTSIEMTTPADTEMEEAEIVLIPIIIQITRIAVTAGIVGLNICS